MESFSEKAEKAGLFIYNAISIALYSNFFVL